MESQSERCSRSPCSASRRSAGPRAAPRTRRKCPAPLLDERRLLEGGIRRGRRQVGPVERIGAFPRLLRRGGTAPERLEEDVQEEQLRQREAEGADRGD